MRGWGRHRELVRFGTLYILILTIIYLASKLRHDMTTEMRQPQIRGTQLRVREFFIYIKSYWLCCRNFPIVSDRYDANGQHEFGAASPRGCDEDATTHETVTMVHVLLYTHSTTLHHYQHMWRQKSTLPSLPLTCRTHDASPQSTTYPSALPSSTGTNDVNADGGYVWTATKVANDAAER